MQEVIKKLKFKEASAIIINAPQNLILDFEK